ncbi:hypothetical protein BGZ83_006488 [Gryganskiella cystojenkinii]|nr:hypothetical protein BGZ83_006488 [Gryganskiella cystojenkinii]
MSHNGCRTFFKTPELIESICSYLSRHDIVQFMAVNRELYVIVQTHFWTLCLDFLPIPQSPFHTLGNIPLADPLENIEAATAAPLGPNIPFGVLLGQDGLLDHGGNFFFENHYDYFFNDDSQLHPHQQRLMAPDRLLVESPWSMEALARNVERVFSVKSRHVFQDAYFDGLTVFLNQFVAAEEYESKSTNDITMTTHDQRTRRAFKKLLNRRPPLPLPDETVLPLAPLARLQRFECTVQHENSSPKTGAPSLKVLWMLQCHLQACMLSSDIPAAMSSSSRRLEEHSTSTLLTHLCLYGLDLENASVVRILAQTLPRLDRLCHLDINSRYEGMVPLQVCRVLFFACPSKSLVSLKLKFHIDHEAPLMDLTVDQQYTGRDEDNTLHEPYCYADDGNIRHEGIQDTDAEGVRGLAFRSRRLSTPEFHDNLVFQSRRATRDSRSYGDLCWELDPFWDRPICARKEPLQRLKSLELPAWAHGYPGDLLYAIFKHCPALELLESPCVASSHDEELMAEAIREYCPRLKVITIFDLDRNVRTESAVAVMDQISESRAALLSQQLVRQRHTGMGITQGQGSEREALADDFTIESLQFRDFDDQDGRLMRAIERHARLFSSSATSTPFSSLLPSSSSSSLPPAFMTRIQLLKSARIRSATIQAILSLCSSLEHFEVDGLSPSRCAIGLGDAVVIRWVCKGIKFLKMAVDPQVVRATPSSSSSSSAGSTGPGNGGDQGGTTLSMATMALTDEHDLGPGAAAASAMERFYRKIGTLTALQVLDLRVVGKRFQFEGDTMGYDVPYVDLSFPGLLKLDPTELSTEQSSSSSFALLDQSRRRSFDPQQQQPQQPHESQSTNQSSQRAALSAKPQHRGYLSALSGLVNLRVLLGSFRQDRILPADRMGQAEFEWISKHWPQLEMVEILPRSLENQLLEVQYDPTAMVFERLSEGPRTGARRHPRFRRPAFPAGAGPVVPGFNQAFFHRVRTPGYQSSDQDSASWHAHARSIAPHLKSLNERMPHLRLSVPEAE